MLGAVHGPIHRLNHHWTIYLDHTPSLGERVLAVVHSDGSNHEAIIVSHHCSCNTQWLWILNS